MALHESQLTPLTLKVRTKGRVTTEEVHLYNDRHFKRVRDLAGLDDQLLIHFDLENDLKPGGGKGGDLMGFTPDSKYLIKEVKPSDQVSLELYAEQYVDQVTSPTKPSLLPLFYLHFMRKSSGTNFVVMNNFLPSPTRFPARMGVLGDDAGAGVTGWDVKYDLKGCMDDKIQERAGKKIVEVHKRFFKFWMYCGCGISDARVLYEQGKRDAFSCQFHVTPQQAKHIQQMIKNDAEWCEKWGLMDHSLVAGVLSHPLSKLEEEPDVSKLFPKSPIADQPYMCQYKGRVWALYLGVIDFLQLWNCTKKCAHCIKLCCAPKPMSTVDPEEYSLQFQELMGRVIGDAEELAIDSDDERTTMQTCHDGDVGSTFWFRADWDDVEEEEVDRWCDEQFERDMNESTYRVQDQF